jgi:hypothetical protein
MQKTVCKNSSRVLCLAGATNPLRLYDIEGALCVQLLMHDFHDKS